MNKTILIILLFAFSIRSIIHAMEETPSTIAKNQKPIYEILAQEDAIRDALIFETSVEEEYSKLIKQYHQYENRLNTIAQYPIASVMGGINYAMSLDDMKQIIKDKFSALRKNGLIISPQEFEKITGKRYIVDTEYKSFDFPVSYQLKKLLEYAAKRFRYLNNFAEHGTVTYEMHLDS